MPLEFDYPFAKLFSTDHGQVLVTREETDERHPAVLFRFKPEGLPLAEMILSFRLEMGLDGSDIEARDRFFNSVTEQVAVRAALAAMGEIDDLEMEETS